MRKLTLYTFQQPSTNTASFQPQGTAGVYLNKTDRVGDRQVKAI